MAAPVAQAMQFSDAGVESRAADETIHTLQNVARMFKIAPLMLLLLEWRGLLRRQQVGDDFVYSWSDCERIALIVKAGNAGLSVSQLAPVIRAMDPQSSASVSDTGLIQCAELIERLETRQAVIGDALAELRRVEWELSERAAPKE